MKVEKRQQVIPRNKQIVEHNDLIDARYDFDVLTHRLFIAALLQIRKEDEDLRNYQIPVRELVDVFDMSTNVYSLLKETAELMTQKAVIGFQQTREDGKRKFAYYPLFRKISYVEDGGEVEIGFNPDLKPRLIQFRNNFTRYELEHVRQFGSQYTFRIYKWLKRIEDWKTELLMDLDDMRYKLRLEDKYENFAHFRQNVLDVAQRELDKYADVSFDWDVAERKGKKVTKIRIRVRLSKKARSGPGPLFAEAPAAPKTLAFVEESADEYDRWWAGLTDQERSRFDEQVELRMAGCTDTGFVRMAEAEMQRRQLYRDHVAAEVRAALDAGQAGE